MLKATAKPALVLALALGVAASGALRFYAPPKKSCCSGQCPMEQEQRGGTCCSPAREPETRIAERNYQPISAAVLPALPLAGHAVEAEPRPAEYFSSPPIAFLHAPTGLSPPAV